MIIRNRLSHLPVISLLLATIMVSPLSAQKWNRYGPGTRSQASAVYDSSTNSMFMFGGQHAPTNVDFNDTWVVKNVIPSSTSTTENLDWMRVSITGKAPNASLRTLCGFQYQFRPNDRFRRGRRLSRSLRERFGSSLISTPWAVDRLGSRMPRPAPCLQFVKDTPRYTTKPTTR